MAKEDTIKSNAIFKGRVISVYKDTVKLKDNTKTTREVVKHKGGCCVVAMDEQENILMVKQFRYPYKTELDELPAGKLDKEGENPKEAIKRELLEETGYRAERWHDLGVLYPTPGYCDENLYLFAAFELKKVADQSLDSGEFLSYHKLPFKKAVEDCIDGKLKDAKTVATILKLDYMLKAGILKSE